MPKDRPIKPEKAKKNSDWLIAKDAAKFSKHKQKLEKVKSEKELQDVIVEAYAADLGKSDVG